MLNNSGFVHGERCRHRRFRIADADAALVRALQKCCIDCCVRCPADAAVDAALLERAFGAGAADASADAALLERAFGIGAADAVVDVVQFCARRRSELKRL